MRWLAAGVLRMPFWPTNSFFTPYAELILAIFWITSGLWYRPSPPMTRNAPSAPSGIDSRMLVMKDSE